MSCYEEEEVNGKGGEEVEDDGGEEEGPSRPPCLAITPSESYHDRLLRQVVVQSF